MSSLPPALYPPLYASLTDMFRHVDKGAVYCQFLYKLHFEMRIILMNIYHYSFECRQKYDYITYISNALDYSVMYCLLIF